MIEGAFTFLLFLFNSPQQVIANHLHGYWEVSIDKTDQARIWNRVFYFDECKDQELSDMDCKGHYGWAEYEGIYLNLYDKSFMTYGIEKEADPVTGKRKLVISDVTYDFILNTIKKDLWLFDPSTGELVMTMEKVPKSELKHN